MRKLLIGVLLLHVAFGGRWPDLQLNSRQGWNLLQESTRLRGTAKRARYEPTRLKRPPRYEAKFLKAQPPLRPAWLQRSTPALEGARR